MTTKVRVINFGPDPVRVKGVNPNDPASGQAGELVYPGAVSNEIFCYDTQNVLVVEEKPAPKAG